MLIAARAVSRQMPVGSLQVVMMTSTVGTTLPRSCRRGRLFAGVNIEIASRIALRLIGATNRDC